ncbi:uncharacterized protein LODBEIA_P13880 [Lodderomyces beijingensis]|uniref:Spindle assembly checkpoint component MAD1 n=1 Tax=Lodderomyces beijingensis TaxID=1775926 RepID=A0ABP0ZG63_9ASCO
MSKPHSSGTASSPFVNSPSRKADISREYAKQNAKIDSQLEISKLKYQLESMQTEKKLWEQEREFITSKYEDAIKKKNEELKQLKLNFDFVYNENQQYESKIKNSADISQAKIAELERETRALKSSNSEWEGKYKSLVEKNDRLIRKHKQVTNDWNTQIQLNDNLSKALAAKEKILESLQQSNRDSVEKLEQFTKLLKRDDSMLTINQNIVSKNEDLKRTNNQLRLKIDQLLQGKTSLELVQQKNISLQNKLAEYEDMRVKCYKLEVEKVEIEARYNEYFNSLSAAIVDGEHPAAEDDDVTKTLKVKNFVSTFKDLQARNLTMKVKYDSKVSEVNELRQELEDSIKEIEKEYLPAITSLQENLKSSSARVVDLERQKFLAGKEIEALRLQIKNLENLFGKAQADQRSSHMEQYVSNLEKVVEEYKLKFEEMQSNHTAADGGGGRGGGSDDFIPTIGSKRQHNEAHSFRKTAADLEKENLRLTAELKRLELEQKEFEEKLRSRNVIDEKQESIRVLEHKNNLLAKDQFVKRETLDALRKENESLINQYVRFPKKETDAVDLIPKALFERQEDDKANLKLKIDELAKRLQRLREVYTLKSRDILVVISKYFGYSIEFLPSTINPVEFSSRLKLVSKYMPKEKNSYLIIDIDNKSLKAFGDYDFKLLCEDLANQWVSKNQFPCLLSALNLKLYEKMFT